MEKFSEVFVKERDPLYKEGFRVGFEISLKIGIEVGMKKGKIERFKEVAVALILETELDDAFIAKVCRLSVGSVNAIRQLIKQHPADYRERIKALMPKL